VDQEPRNIQALASFKLDVRTLVRVVKESKAALLKKKKKGKKKQN